MGVGKRILSGARFRAKVRHPRTRFHRVGGGGGNGCLIPLFTASRIHRVTPGNRLLGDMGLSNAPFSSTFLSGKSYLITYKSTRYFIRLGLRSGQVIHQIGTGSVRNMRLFFMTRLFPLRGKKLCVYG